MRLVNRVNVMNVFKRQVSIKLQKCVNIYVVTILSSLQMERNVMMGILMILMAVVIIVEFMPGIIVLMLMKHQFVLSALRISLRVQTKNVTMGIC